MTRLAALALCLLAGHAVAQGVTPTQVLIGQSAPLTGANAELGKASLPVVSEYRAAMDKQFGDKAYSFTSLESYMGAKVAVEAMRRAGPKLSHEGYMKALDGMNEFDVGGYVVGFSPANHNGSSYVELTVISKDQSFKH